MGHKVLSHYNCTIKGDDLTTDNISLTTKMLSCLHSIETITKDYSIESFNIDIN